MWRTPKRKAFTPTGLALGSTVVGTGLPGPGQTWARAPKKCWWVVTPDGTAHLCHEDSLIVLGQCTDRPLPIITAA